MVQIALGRRSSGWLAITLGMVLLVAGCSHARRSSESADNPSDYHAVVDAANHRRDPRGGFFAPWLTDVFVKGSDKPLVFCGWTGAFSQSDQPVTIWHTEQPRRADRSACWQLVAIGDKNESVWLDGRGISREQYDRKLQTERAKELYFVTGTVQKVATPEQLGKAAPWMFPSGIAPYTRTEMEIEATGPLNLQSKFATASPIPYNGQSFCGSNPDLRSGTRVRIEFRQRILPSGGVECLQVASIKVLGSTFPSAANASRPDEDPESRSLNGNYMPTKRITGIGEIDYLSLYDIDQKANPAPLSGELHFSGGSSIPLSTVKLHGKHLEFSASRAEAIYIFSGDFLGNPSWKPEAAAIPVLHGTLRKTAVGKPMISINADFTYWAGD
jgi:hypothetical protein